MPTYLAWLLLAAASVSVHAQNASSDHERTLQQMQMTIHRAVRLAAEGGNLVALGGMRETGGVDELSVERGRAMIADAKEIIREVASGETMMHLHTQELSDAANARMIQTHALEQAASSYISALERSLE